MKEICIPISNLGDDEIADVIVTIGGKKMSYSFRVESFPWSINSEQSSTESDTLHATLEQITQLRDSLAHYDKGWELIQIFTPRAGATHIQVLYRKKNGH
ncbi:MAG: hypothetical protein EHM93_12010 [Bacteroidales bacterium]|nr:MAG: hypothetical protein EHM93_12010 [Bacteroidales bacterium]